VQYDTGRSVGLGYAVEQRSIDELASVLPATDYLVVVVPRTDGTEGLIGDREFALLKPGASLVNVARGGIVDEAALRAALDRGDLRYASLDVFDDEPLPPESPWWTHPQVVVTPHVAGLASRYREQVLELVSTNVVRYEDGRPLLNRADRAAGY
jgi:phosphoglycerate dehydrogenase-like enzyme